MRQILLHLPEISPRFVDGGLSVVVEDVARRFHQDDAVPVVLSIVGVSSEAVDFPRHLVPVGPLGQVGDADGDERVDPLDFVESGARCRFGVEDTDGLAAELVHQIEAIATNDANLSDGLDGLEAGDVEGGSGTLMVISP